MSYPIYLLFGVAPSAIWLFYYLRKDVHPESTSMILKIFLWGMIISLPAVLIELGAFDVFESFNLPKNITAILNIFIGVALVEEMLKYFIIREKVIKDPAFDEPTDAALYMIIAALGFAAVENILILFQLGPAFFFAKAMEISVFRFVGATLLHALTSGFIGYFLALSFFGKNKKGGLMFLGIGGAVLLHGLYNFSIMKIPDNFKLILPLIIIIGLSIFLYFGFKKLRKMENHRINE